MSIISCTSPRPSCTIFPASSVTSAPSASFSRRSSSPSSRTSSPRRGAGTSRQASKAVVARVTAASTSSGVALRRWAMGAPVIGVRTSRSPSRIDAGSSPRRVRMASVSGMWLAAPSSRRAIGTESRSLIPNSRAPGRVTVAWMPAGGGAAAANRRIAASSVTPIFPISALPASLRCLVRTRPGHHGIGNQRSRSSRPGDPPSGEWAGGHPNGTMRSGAFPRLPAPCPCPNRHRPNATPRPPGYVRTRR